jgi:hypothetical protein
LDNAADELNRNDPKARFTENEAAEARFSLWGKRLRTPYIDIYENAPFAPGMTAATDAIRFNAGSKSKRTGPIFMYPLK